MRTAIRWGRRAALMAGLAAVTARFLRRKQAGDKNVAAVGGDTWPPVPLNPSRRD